MDQELVQYLEGRFQRQEQGIHTLLNEGFDRQEQRFNARFDAVDQRIEEVKRHAGVLVEGLRHEIQLVAEGLVMHIEVRHREDREYFDRKFEGMSTLFHSSHDHLQQQHEQLQQSQDQLRQRVDTLERKSPN
jgi:hypothetical protein